MNKQVTNSNDSPQIQGASDNFTGTAFIQPIIATEDKSMTVGRVTFQIDTRTVWHTHRGEQVLYFLEGKGRVEIEGQGVIDADPEDIVRIPPNTRHWHGAHPDEPNHMRHIAITTGGVSWAEPVSEEDYRK